MLGPSDHCMEEIPARKRDNIRPREDKREGSSPEAVGRRMVGRAGHGLLVPVHAIRASWAGVWAELVDQNCRRSELDDGTAVPVVAGEG